MNQTLEKFSYIGKWYGPKDGKYESKDICLSMEAKGTVTAVAKYWVFTARHVAKNKAKDPDRPIKIVFGEWSTFDLDRVEIFPEKRPDFALVRLGEPLEIQHFPKIRAKPLLPEDGEQEIVIVGKSGVYDNNRAVSIGRRRLKRVTHQNIAAGGDSGGAWIQRSSIETQPHVLLAILRGCGIAIQPGALRDWIEDVMGDEAAELQWS